MKITIVLDPSDPDGIADAEKVVQIIKARANLPVSTTKSISRLQMIRIVQNYAKLIAFESGHKDWKDVKYTTLREIKTFIDEAWRKLD